MHPTRLALPVIFFLLLFSAPNVFAADKASAATRTMAEIMIGLHHYPNDADKDTLKKLTGEAATTGDEKIIAQALLNLKHQPADADKPKLDAITKDAAAPAAVKSLASILLKLNHQPSDADITALKQLTK